MASLLGPFHSHSHRGHTMVKIFVRPFATAFASTFRKGPSHIAATSSHSCNINSVHANIAKSICLSSRRTWRQQFSNASCNSQLTLPLFASSNVGSNTSSSSRGPSFVRRLSTNSESKSSSSAAFIDRLLGDTSTSNADTNVDSNPNQRSDQKQQQQQQQQPLRMVSSGFALPDAPKAHSGGEDAWFASPCGRYAGVFDGVGG